MGIGADIKEVTIEAGTEITVLRSPSTFTEYMTIDTEGKSSSPFMREYGLTASFVYDTAIVSGDLIQFKGMTYVVTTMTPDEFEDEIVEYTAFLFKCNKGGFKVLTWNQTQNTTTYKITAGWSVRVSSGYGLFYKDFNGNVVNPDTSSGKTPSFFLECIVPESYGVVRGDRIYFSASEYYKVHDIVRYAFPGVTTLRLAEDDRGSYTP